MSTFTLLVYPRSVNTLGAFVVSNTVLSEVCQKRLFTSHRCLQGAVRHLNSENRSAEDGTAQSLHSTHWQSVLLSGI